jgi:excisionase family DNA binding protein
MDRNAEDLLTLEQAAQRYGVSVDTLRRRVVAGELPVFVDGRDRRRRLVSVTDLELVFRPRLVTPAA